MLLLTSVNKMKCITHNIEMKLVPDPFTSADYGYECPRCAYEAAQGA